MERPTAPSPTRAAQPRRPGAAEAAAAEQRNRLLAQAEERLRRIIDSIADAVVVVDAEGVVKLANPAAGELFGRSREELVGDHFGLPLVAGETTEVDLRDGLVAEMRTVEILWEDEPAWLASLRDVTARREAEDAARRLWQERTAREEAEKERARLEELLFRAPAAILTTRGPDLRCAFANPEMARLVSDPELPGRPLAAALSALAGQGFLEGFEETFRERAGRGRRELPLAVPAGDGRRAERFVDVTWEPLLRDGGVEGVLCFAYDVTAQVETRRELETTMGRLREEEQAKNQFLAVLGHELRNPLAGIDSGLQLLEKNLDGAGAEWPLAMMRKQVRVLAGLLDDLFDVSAITRGKLELQTQALVLGDVVAAAVAAVQGRYEERRQRLAVSVPEEPIAVDGDPRRLGQALTNLLVNASKYSPPETAVELSVRRAGGEVAIAVSDHGDGIPAEMLDQIFEPFVQGGAGGRTAGGLGIGLTLVRQLVELHGGRVTAASAGPGRGSTFTVRLPIACPPRAAAPRPAAADAASLAGCRVLVVDDNEDAGRALGELLALRGCTVELATRGAEAVDKAAAAPPDVVLLDLDLPDTTGYEVARELRAEPRLAGVLIVAVSGFGHDEAKSRSAAAGIDHHLVKPVELERLLELVAERAARR